MADLVAVTPAAGFVNSMGAIAYLIAKVIDMTIGLRVSAEDEQTGLDTTIHAENAYEHGAFGAR